jgi:glutaconate CoA-transferase subunit A
MSCERVVPTDALLNEGPVETLMIHRMMTAGVVEAPRGAHFTDCGPDYGRDEAFQRLYAATGKDPEAWAEFSSTYLEVADEAAYREAIASR